VSAVVGAAVPAAVCRWGLARAVLMWGGVSDVSHSRHLPLGLNIIINTRDTKVTVLRYRREIQVKYRRDNPKIHARGGLCSTRLRV